MFWGTVIKKGKPYKISSAFEEQADYPVLHISNVALPANASSSGKTYLLLSNDKGIKDLTLACLQKDKKEVQPFDIYINNSQKLTLTVQGDSDLHLSGYFEPMSNELDEDMLFDGEDEDEEEEEETGGKINSNLR